MKKRSISELSSYQQRITTCVNELMTGVIGDKRDVLITRRKVLLKFLDFLIREAYILNYTVAETQRHYRVVLRYDRQGNAVISKIVSLSVRTRLVYLKYSLILRLKNLTMVYVFYTTSGYMTHHQTLKKNLGGLLVCVIV
jgi:ribosomal protein S8